MQTHRLLRCPLIFAAALLGLLICNPANAQESKRIFDLPAGEAEKALKLFSEQSGRGLLVTTETARGVRTQEVKGEFVPREALDRMLARTGLVASEDPKNGAFVVRRENPVEPKNVPSRPVNDRAASDEPKVVELPTFEVMGSKLLNMDIQRSRDDAQPYVVFKRDTIEQSGSRNLEEFFKKRLTANVAANTSAQAASSILGASSNSLNLRGLGTTQTLILIDGHRVPDRNIGTGVVQPDINHIPVAAIERVEVLPTTSSGIYGGSATGGVINIVLRRDYSGAEVRLSYDNTFAGDAAARRADFSAGINFNSGRTNLLIAASYSSENALLNHDRDFVRRGIETLIRNNPTTTTLFSTTPPLGSLPNIRAQTGANLVLKNGRPLNSPFTSVPAGYAGPASDGGAALVGRAGQYNLDLSPDATQGINAVPGGHSSLLNAPASESIMATVRHEFLPALQGFLELAAANSTGRAFYSSAGTSFTVPVAAATNPFLQPIVVTLPNPAANDLTVSRNQDRRIVAGLIARLPWGWKAEADLTWQTYNLSFNGYSALKSSFTSAITAGQLDLLRDSYPTAADLAPHVGRSTYISSARSRMVDAAARASGPIFRLPAGEVNLAALVEWRDTDLAASRTEFTSLNVFNANPRRAQTVTSYYLEAKAPLLPGREADASPALELQLATRHDEYMLESAAPVNSLPLGSAVPPEVRARTDLSSTNPTIAVRYDTGRGIVVRASYGTGFQPPTMTQLTTTVTQNAGGATFVDPRRGNSFLGPFVSMSGGNSELRPERSHNWSFGTVIVPNMLPKLRLSLDYTRIRKTDNIAGGTTNAFAALLAAEDLNPGRIIRGANLPGDLPGWAGPVVIIDSRLRNGARAELEALDLQFDQELKVAGGTLHIFAMATRTLKYRTQLTPSVATVENVGISRTNPLRLKASAGATWSRGPWSLGWNATYFDSYQVSMTAIDLLNQGGDGRVASQTYHDITAGYRFNRQANGWRRILSNTGIQVGVNNVLNQSPPFDASPFGSYYSTFGDPRLASYFVSVRKQL